MIPHIPHFSRNSKSDSSYSSWGIAISRGSPYGLFPSEGLNSEDNPISMGSNNSSEMNIDNNDEADSNDLRNLIAQQTVVQMQEHSFKNLHFGIKPLIDQHSLIT